MSADNAICVARMGDAWWVWMGFASDDWGDPKDSRNARSFPTYEEAADYAFAWMTRESVVEYGVQILSSPPKPAARLPRRSVLGWLRKRFAWRGR